MLGTPPIAADPGPEEAEHVWPPIGCRPGVAPAGTPLLGIEAGDGAGFIGVGTALTIPTPEVRVIQLWLRKRSVVGVFRAAAAMT